MNRAMITPLPTAQGAFVQGLVSHGLLGWVQERTLAPALDKRTLRLALQGGTALAAGTIAAQSWQRQNFTGALMAVAMGAAGVVAIEHLVK